MKGQGLMLGQQDGSNFYLGSKLTDAHLITWQKTPGGLPEDKRQPDERFKLRQCTDSITAFFSYTVRRQ